jgi:preprotein translocase subunit SecG
MGLVSAILLIFFVIASVFLILLVLVQDEHGEGLGGLFSGSGASFGPRTGNVLTRFTTILAAAFLAGAFAVAWLNRTPELGDVVSRARLEAIQSGEQDAWWVQSEGSLEATPASGEAAEGQPEQQAEQPQSVQ